jgi:glycerol uptake facilitator-like aquaporin
MTIVDAWQHRLPWRDVAYIGGQVRFAVTVSVIGAYWFTSSTSFADPAVTITRSLSDTFADIRPMDAPGFIIAQLLGPTAATFRLSHLAPTTQGIAPMAVVPDPEGHHANSAIRSRIRP